MTIVALERIISCAAFEAVTSAAANKEIVAIAAA